MLVRRSGRASRRLLQLPLRAACAHEAPREISSTDPAPRRTLSLRLASTTAATVPPSFLTQHLHHQNSDLTGHAQQRRSYSSPGPQTPAVPQDEFEELKTFLAEPVAAGPRQQRAREIVTSMMKHHVHADMHGQEATVMVMVADAMEDHVFVLEVYECLRDHGVSPSPLTLEYAAVACAELGRWRTALEVLEFMHQAVEIMQPSLDIYENAMIACHVDGKWMRAKHLLEEMRTYGLEASPELHLTSIRLCITSKESTATKVLTRSFLDAFEEEMMPEDTQHKLTELFVAAVDAQSLSQALFFRDELLTRHCDVPKDLYTKLLHLCAEKRQWHQARVLLGQLTDANAVPPPPSRHYTDDIALFLAEMQTLDMDLPLSVYNAALRNYARIANFKEASRIFTSMRERGVTPDATSFAAMLTACGSRLNESEGLFQELLASPSDTCALSLDAVHGYVLAASRAHDWDEVLRRYQLVSDSELQSQSLPLEGDVRIQSIVAVAYGQLARPKETLRVFTKMKVKGLEPNLHVYGQALFAYIQLDQWRHALLLFDHLRQQQSPQMQDPRRFVGFSMIWDAVVLACVRGEQTQRGAELFDMIVQQRVPISPVSGERLAALLTDVPTATLWTSFKAIDSLHHRVQPPHAPNPRVLNAVLKRAVDEQDEYLAERVVAEGDQELRLVFNSMTYALMLRLYADQENQTKFHDWCCEMQDAQVKTTRFVFRALLRHLGTLARDCERPEYLEAVGHVVRGELPALASLGLVESNDKEKISGDQREMAAELGRTALNTMEGQGLELDARCLEYYLRLSQRPEHTTRVLQLVEDSLAVSSLEDAESTLTPRLLHTLLLALGHYPDGDRVRKLVVALLQKLPREASVDALAAYCASNDGDNVLLLLQEVLATGCALEDEQVLLFLTSSFASGDTPKGSRPQSANGVVVTMAALLGESEAVNMEASCLAFLLQHVVELSNWQQQDAFWASTEEEIDSMKQLLVRAFANFSIAQVREFLSKVVKESDAGHVESVLTALEEEQDAE